MNITTIADDELITSGRIAEILGESPARISYILHRRERRSILPVTQAGPSNLYRKTEVLPHVRLAIQQIEARQNKNGNA